MKKIEFFFLHILYQNTLKYIPKKFRGPEWSFRPFPSVDPWATGQGSTESGSDPELAALYLNVVVSILNLLSYMSQIYFEGLGTSRATFR